jgi:hypothetical protein
MSLEVIAERQVRVVQGAWRRRASQNPEPRGAADADKAVSVPNTLTLDASRLLPSTLRVFDLARGAGEVIFTGTEEAKGG